MRTWITIITIVFCGVLTPSLSAEDASVIQLDDSRWQPLPTGIRGARTAPDGRVWFLDEREYSPLELLALKKHLEEQYTKKAPLLRDVKLMLFEPGGRVWFYSYRLQTILAYDGKAWITHPVGDMHDRLFNHCLTRGGLIDSDAHRFVEGVAWLRGAQGIYRYDGKKLTYQAMPRGKVARGYSAGRLYLSVHPSGKLAVAHWQYTSDMWIFRDGKWMNTKFLAVPPKEYALHFTVETLSSLLYVDRSRRLHRLLIRDDGRLRHESTHLDSAPLGDLRVRTVRALYTDTQGRIYVAADVIENIKAKKDETDPALDGDAPRGSVVIHEPGHTRHSREGGNPDAPRGGVVIHEPGESSRAVRAKGLANAWHPRYSRHLLPVLTQSRKRVWLEWH